MASIGGTGAPTTIVKRSFERHSYDEKLMLIPAKDEPDQQQYKNTPTIKVEKPSENGKPKDSVDIRKQTIELIKVKNQGVVFHDPVPYTKKVSGANPGAGKVVALTFDDGPSAKYTMQYVNILKKYDVSTALGFRVVLWNVDTLDWKIPSVSNIVHTAVTKAKDGSIVLLHEGKPETLEALPQIITGLKGRGFKFVTVSQLFK